MHRGKSGAANLNVEPSKSLKSRRGRGASRRDVSLRVKRQGYAMWPYNKELSSRGIGMFKDMAGSLPFWEEKDLWNAQWIDGGTSSTTIRISMKLVHAYAVSVHKSQGSEYPAVLIPILTQHYVLLQRNLRVYWRDQRKEACLWLWERRERRMAIAVRE